MEGEGKIAEAYRVCEVGKVGHKWRCYPYLRTQTAHPVTEEKGVSMGTDDINLALWMHKMLLRRLCNVLKITEFI